MTLGERIREARETARLSQKELGQSLREPMGQATVSSWEKEKPPARHRGLRQRPRNRCGIGTAFPRQITIECPAAAGRVIRRAR